MQTSTSTPTSRRRTTVGALALVLTALAAGCAPVQAAPVPSVAPGTSAEPVAPPEWLRDTGLYSDVAQRIVAADVLSFEPQYPLWTDGAVKRRWIRIPAGAAIDASDPDAWVFPVGTRLWKEFAIERPIETRYLEKLPNGSWLRATYLWPADGGEARLAPVAGLRNACESAPGVPYDVPGLADCATCHAKGDGVLGFSALQLSPDRDPLAPHAARSVPADQTLPAFVERGLVRDLPEELLATPPRIEARTPRERAVRGYFSTHCGSCHFDGGLLAGLSMELDARLSEDDARTLTTILKRPARYQPAGPGDSALLTRVEPGAPEDSAVVRRMRTREPLAQMPPIGTNLVDREALELIEAWIREDLVTESRP